MNGLPAAGVGETPIVAAPAQPTGYAGLATRVVSFTIDAALITVVDVIIGVGAALILSLLHIPHGLRTILAVIGGVAYVAGSIAYFVIFWSAAGQTPGARVMQIQVLTADLEPVKPKRALIRCIGVILAALPLFIGFVPILYDSRRRGFQDQFAHTVVIEAPGPSIAELSRTKKRAMYEASRRSSSEREREATN